MGYWLAIRLRHSLQSLQDHEPTIPTAIVWLSNVPSSLAALSRGNVEMITYALRNHADRNLIIDAIQELPVDDSKRVKIVDAEKRQEAQNNLSWFWYTHIAAETGDTINAVHQQCKLTYGVPILLRDDEDFAEFWQLLSAYSYEEKLQAMECVPVTSIMLVKQFAEYLDTMETDYGRNGIPLPKKDDVYYEALGYKRC